MAIISYPISTGSGGGGIPYTTGLIAGFVSDKAITINSGYSLSDGNLTAAIVSDNSTFYFKNLSNLIGGLSVLTIIIAAKRKNINSKESILNCGTTGSIFSIENNGKWYADGANLAFQLTHTVDTREVLTFKFNAGSCTGYRNGTSEQTGSVAGATIPNVANKDGIIGHLSWGSGYNFNGEINSILIFNSALSDTNRTANEDYLKTLLGI